MFPAAHSSFAAVGVSHGYAAGFEGSADGVGVDVEAGADAGEGDSFGVEAYGVVGAGWVESLSAEGDAVAVKVSGDGDAVDVEPGGEVVDGLAVLVGRDEVSDLLGG